MDNKLSELSNPVAEVVSKFGDPEAFGEREIKLLIGIQQMAYGTKFYSQEYVSAIIQRSDRLDSMLTESIQALKAAEQHIAELSRLLAHNIERAEAAEAKLATPVRLPKTNGYWTEQEKAFEDAITLAKREIRLAGFTVEGG